MSNLPIILVISKGEEKSEDIISNIRNIPIEDGREELDSETGTFGYKYHLQTKYYTTDIILCPLKCPLEDCPLNLLNFIEGVLIYFDANNREFLKDLPTYASFLETNQIEFGILLCHELFDDSKDGITYKESKQYSTLLDVIELGRKRDTDDEEDDQHDPIGYDELLQAIRSFIWSNVNVNGENRSLQGYVNLGADDVDLVEIVSELAKESSSKLANTPDKNLESEEEIETALENFEKLLSDVMDFKMKTESMTREECLNFAKGFAEQFDDLIGPESDDESE